MPDWNAARYLRFAEERTRPAAELLVRVPLEAAHHVVDLGCGPANSTALLTKRFPDADILGIDSSPDMLAQAHRALPRARFVLADIRTWQPETAPDLIFANASLQWLPEHAELLPRLAQALAPGGCLAVQMPDNLEEPSHRLMREVASRDPWRKMIGDPAPARARIAPAGLYYDSLVAAGCAVDIWRTTYHHPLRDAAAIVGWLSATGLRPFLDRLSPEAQPGFLAAYEAALAEAYPPRADGLVLLVFPRLFIVARRDG